MHRAARQESLLNGYLEFQANLYPEIVEPRLFHALLQDTDGELIDKRFTAERGPMGLWSTQTF